MLRTRRWMWAASLLLATVLLGGCPETGSQSQPSNGELGERMEEPAGSADPAEGPGSADPLPTTTGSPELPATGAIPPPMGPPPEDPPAPGSPSPSEPGPPPG